MFRNYVLNVRVTLYNGSHVCGPVTIRYYFTYHFYNYTNNSDFFIIMRKGNSGWYQFKGYRTEVSQSVIHKISYSINFFIAESN